MAVAWSHVHPQKSPHRGIQPEAALAKNSLHFAKLALAVVGRSRTSNPRSPTTQGINLWQRS
jgi:hypothetical protein